MLMTGTPSRSSSRARSAITCSRSGTTLTSTHLAAGALEQLEHLHVLLGRQRDVQVVDRLARRDLRRLVDACRAAAARGSRGDRRRRGRRRSRRSDSRARGARGSCRRRAARARPTPAIRIRFSPMPARQRRSSTSRISSRDANVSATFSTRKIAQTGCDTSKAPRRAARVGWRSRSARTAWRRCRRRTARMLPTNTAKKSSTRDRPRRRRYRPCRWKPSGTSAAMNGSRLMYCCSGGRPLRDRDEAGVEPQRVGDDERRHAEQRVGEDVERDEQPVVPVHHARLVAASVSRDQRFDLVAEPLAAEPFGVTPDGRRVEPVGRAARLMASANAAGDGSSTRKPGFAVDDRFDARRRAPSATTGRPHACASSGTMPKSSSPGSSDHRCAAVQRRGSLVGQAAEEPDVGPSRAGVRAPRARGRRRRSAAACRPGAQASMASVDALVGHQRRHDERETARAGRCPDGRKSVSTGGYTTVASRL